MLREKELLGKLESEYNEYLYKNHPIPKPYYEDLEGVKAILLGSNPVAFGEMASGDYVFNLATFNRSHGEGSIFGNIYSNLIGVGLELWDIYAQNLCKNYFVNLSVHDDKWEEIASLWADVLKVELDTLFDKDIPVLITAPWMIKPLCKEAKAPRYYYEKIEFINPKDNKLGRNLIPFFRQTEYCFLNNEWESYRQAIKKELSKELAKQY